jgi:hypothetical protein
MVRSAHPLRLSRLSRFMCNAAPVGFLPAFAGARQRVLAIMNCSSFGMLVFLKAEFGK